MMVSAPQPLYCASRRVRLGAIEGRIDMVSKTATLRAGKAQAKKSPPKAQTTKPVKRRTKPSVARAKVGQKMKLALAQKKDARYVEGRRAFFEYRDLGVTEATSGRMRAQVTTAKEAMTRATGWHTHNCEIQFVYMLKGWADLEFEDRGAVRLEAGDSVMIPGGCRHQEVRTSNDFEIIEISLPADMGTEPAESPATRR
jgi:quercetin dioxygenase-like cupin family protein